MSEITLQLRSLCCPQNCLGTDPGAQVGQSTVEAASCCSCCVFVGAGIVPQLLQLYEDAYSDSSAKPSPTPQAALTVERPEVKSEPRAEPAH